MKRVNWKYTVGEILIVMVGILLAFQLQTWNEHRKESGLVDSYLTNLKENLLQDQTQLDRQKFALNNIDSGLTVLNQLMISKRAVVLDNQQMDLIKDITNWYFFFGRNTTFNDLYNSGRLNLLPDLDLRLDLSTYYEYCELMKTFDNYTAETQLTYNEVIIKNVPFGRGGWKVDEQMKFQLTNMAWDIKGRIRSNTGHLANITEINQSLVKQIDVLLND